MLKENPMVLIRVRRPRPKLQRKLQRREAAAQGLVGVGLVRVRTAPPKLQGEQGRGCSLRFE